jgi:hypothetical protein
MLFQSAKQKHVICVLLDLTKGAIHPEDLIIPPEDNCSMNLASYIEFGYRGKVLVHCQIRGRMKATLYDLVESNKTGTIQLVLRNGIEILSFRKYPNYGHNQRVLSKDVYTLQCDSSSTCFIMFYPSINQYQPNRHLVKRLEHDVKWPGEMKLLLNIHSNILYVVWVPGPHAIGLTCKISDDLVKHRSGKTCCDEFIMSFQLDSEVKLNTFYFNPKDGKLLHITLKVQEDTKKIILNTVEIFGEEN